ncbi:carbohydrate ABC transporter permease [Microcella daejeonensis]|uniref:carbohydrate ABC transporter permease n=1 Tax=Microcella daejeonensis TaxID=2994971 RepID=UPI00226E6C82|nr:carbohydrate ABC transporter permease [Microcella daejeonensis]WAB84368.1 carbohydrate ABC transporter permease [Microcella daejeonensis]
MSIIDSTTVPAEASATIVPGKRRPRARRRKLGPAGVAKRVVHYGLLIAVLLLLVGPFVFTLGTALKGPGDSVFSYPPYFIPRDPTLDNFAKVADVIPVWTFIGNSVIVATVSTATNILFGSMAGYVLARLRFKGNTAAYLLFLGTLVIPFEVIFISVFLTTRQLGLVDTLAGVILPSAVSGFSILLFRSAFLSLPKAIDEAAVLDGASEFQRYWRVSLPQVKGTAAVVGIFSFMFAWDDFLWPQIVLTSQENYTLTVGLQFLSGAFAGDDKVVAAGTMIAVIPLIIAFFFAQKWFFRGAGEGAVKG